MNAREMALALVAFMALVAMAPVWLAYTGSADLTSQTRWMASLILPALGTLLVVSWVKPSMTRPVVGVFFLASIMAIVPQIWSMGKMAAGITPSGSASEIMFQLGAPILFIAFAAAMGWRRLVRG